MGTHLFESIYGIFPKKMKRRAKKGHPLYRDHIITQNLHLRTTLTALPILPWFAWFSQTLQEWRGWRLPSTIDPRLVYLWSSQIMLSKRLGRNNEETDGFSNGKANRINCIVLETSSFIRMSARNTVYFILSCPFCFFLLCASSTLLSVWFLNLNNTSLISICLTKRLQILKIVWKCQNEWDNSVFTPTTPFIVKLVC